MEGATDVQGYDRAWRDAALVARLAGELEASEWWPGEEHDARRREHLAALLSHAARTVPFYRERIPAHLTDATRALDAGALTEVPVLERAEVQAAGDRLISEAPPPGHGAVHRVRSSGSTGRPTEFVVSARESLLRMAISMRRHRWRGLDSGAAIATIRFTTGEGAEYPRGLAKDGATAPAPWPGPRGPLHLLAIDTPINDQLEWLARVRPAYLATYPTNLRALLERARERGLRLEGLQMVGTFAEAQPEGLEALCREIWGVPVSDNYSAVEVGSIATTCPAGSGRHIHEEMVHVELLDELGEPVEEGALGRVVVTPLFNHVMPLVRYAIGDYAVRGARCACGRQLAVIDRIAGRARNMLVLPNGDLTWPQFGTRRLSQGLPVRQFQLAQTARLRIEARLVTTRALTEAEKHSIRSMLRERLDTRFEIDIVNRDAIARGPQMKYEDFVCELEP